MKKTDKKGFTIVELVIVIAVIAILIAVLIPTFSKIIGKANESNDTQIVRQLNTAIEIESVTADEGKPVTMYDANEMTKLYGLDVERLATKSNLSIAWDCKNHRFVLLNEDENKYIFPVDAANSQQDTIATPTDYFVVRKAMPATAKYSIYAAEGWSGTEISDLTVGFDAGNVKDITSVTYSSTAGQDVVIRTNGGKLTIDAKNDEVAHFGFASELDIKSVKASSYTENGTVQFAEIAGGNFVLAPGAEVSNIHFDANGNTFVNADGLKISVDLSQATMTPDFSRDPVAIADSGTLVAQVKTSEDDYIWLTKIGVIEQITLSDSATEAKNNYAEKTDANYAIADQIANNVERNANGTIADKEIKVNNVDYTVKFNEETKDFETYKGIGTEVETTPTTDLTAEQQKQAIKEQVVEKPASKEEILAGATMFASGKGTKASPWGISCVEEWNAMNTKIAEAGSEYYFVVIKDFGFNADEPMDNACLAGKTVSFHLDGGNHTVGITHNQTASYKNIFGREAKNVYVNNITFDYAFDYAGDLSFTYTTSADCDCEFTNVTITGNINSNDTTAWLCPLIQYPAGSVKYTNVTNYANFSGAADIAAPFGVHAYGTALITFDKCVNYGTIIGSNVGGFWGQGMSSSKVIFKDTNAVKNYGDVYGTAAAGHFAKDASGTTFTDKNGLVVTVAQEGSYAEKYAKFTSTAPANYGDAFVFDEVAGATSYSVKVSFSSSKYGYVGVGDVWGGGFGVGLQDDYTASDVVNGKITTAFKKLYIAEKQESKKHYVSKANVEYTNGIYYSNFTSSDVLIAPIVNGNVSLIKTAEKEFYYYDSNDGFGALIGDSETTNKTVTFTVYAYNATGKILKTSTCSYTMSVADARAYFGD